MFRVKNDMRLLHGIDLVDCPRIEDMLQRHGERFLDRVFTATEQAYADSQKNRIEKLAEFHILEAEVTTSARRYHQNGIIRLQLLFGAIHLMYALGCDQETIVRYYRENISEE